MPKRTDIRKILIIGSGPIVIGQGCEFDYSGTQACKALRREGYEIVLVNSNPATIMTDPEMADKTYIEPLTVETLRSVIALERPDAVLPTVGGQTALNLAVELAEAGILDEFNVELIGAQPEAIRTAEDRRLFKLAMDEIGLSMPRGAFVRTFEEAVFAAERIGFPVVVRPSFTLGGSGGGTARNLSEFKQIASRGLALSPIGEILVEESVVGWKEFELEVMRDRDDNAVVICSIENFDPMGVHTGDSITVAPAQTLTDREYQTMVNAGLAVIRKVGVETGGSNIQFAVSPKDGKLHVIEMNPRVSRSSALASKATGFPIAKIAAKLAVGYTLDEIPNDITRETLASFEPVIDYVVVKIPKWAFEKFPTADPTLGTQMKSVGEVMAIGRTFKEALMKGLRSLEGGSIRHAASDLSNDILLDKLATPDPGRLALLFEALWRETDVETLHGVTGIDPWFLNNLRQIVETRKCLEKRFFTAKDARDAKKIGFSDVQLAGIFGVSENEVRRMRREAGIVPVFKRVDTCSAEFESFTPYLYSTYEDECEAAPTDRPKIMILGSGPNRIGQGLEFDYCCCHASFALKAAGFETIMVNCNPETVSTDYDTADRLYFEPITFEDVMNIVEVERPQGVIVQFGGQTPLNIARRLAEAGVPVVGTSPDSIDLAEDRKRFGELLETLQIPHPEDGTATNIEEALGVAEKIGFPVLARPSYVLGGRAMRIIRNRTELEEYVSAAVEVSSERPLLIDRFLEGAVEVDVDALSDGFRTVIAGVQEHVESAGIHSGDSSCVMPPQHISDEIVQSLCGYTRTLATALGVVGLVNVQFAVQNGDVFVLEVNPRASRSVPFVSKATGVPVADIAARLMVGWTLDEFDLPDVLKVRNVCVKSPVFPFAKFPGVDPVLGPEMRSTGEVMGIGETFEDAYLKAMTGANLRLPENGTIYLSVSPAERSALEAEIRALNGFDFKFAESNGQNLAEIVDLLKSKRIGWVIDTQAWSSADFGAAVRSVAVQYGVPCSTSFEAARAAIQAVLNARTQGRGDARNNTCLPLRPCVLAPLR